MQAKFKHRVLLEVVQIAVDLYGGHFRFADEELAHSEVKRRDDDRQVPAMDADFPAGRPD